MHYVRRQQRWKLVVARMLFETGADVSAQDKDGWTPLHLASREGQLEVAHILIERGVDVSAQDKNGQTPLHLVSQKGHSEVGRTLFGNVNALRPASQRGKLEVARMLIEHGADVSAQDEDGWTPLHLALQEETTGSRSYTYRAWPGCVSPGQGRPDTHYIWRRKERGNWVVAHILIERGADVSTKDKYGLTPLHLASREEQLEVARMLIEGGADVSAQDKDGRTPLHLALQRGRPGSRPHAFRA